MVVARSISDVPTAQAPLIADQVTQRLALANRSTATPQLPRDKGAKRVDGHGGSAPPLLAAVGRSHGGKEGQRKGKAEATLVLLVATHPCAGCVHAS
jgi:hypothetical protein